MSTATCPTFEPISISVALDRLQREAEQGTVDLERYRSAYVAWGDGPPLVFIHGLGDQAHTFALIMAHLSRHYRCFAYNLPTGRDDGARLRQYRHEDLKDDLLAVVEHFNLPQTVLAGHSFGTSVALRALAEHTDRFSRGVLMCGFAHRPLHAQHWWLAWLGKWLVPGGKLGWLRNREKFLRHVHFRGYELHEPERWQWFVETTSQAPLGAMGHWGLEIHRLDLRPLLPKVSQPVLLVAGDKDPLVADHHQTELLAGLPRAMMFRVSGAGHIPTQTHPETVAQTIVKFLSLPACLFGSTAENVCQGEEGACLTHAVREEAPTPVCSETH